MRKNVRLADVLRKSCKFIVSSGTGSFMFDSKVFDDLAQKLSNVLPESLQTAKHDVEKNFKQILQSSFAKLDLVTREEFDVQTKVLLRTREKLDNIEAELSLLEQKIAKSNTTKD